MTISKLSQKGIPIRRLRLGIVLGIITLVTCSSLS